MIDNQELIEKKVEMGFWTSLEQVLRPLARAFTGAFLSFPPAAGRTSPVAVPISIDNERHT